MRLIKLNLFFESTSSCQFIGSRCTKKLFKRKWLCYRRIRSRLCKSDFWGWTFSIANPPSRKLAIRFHDLHHVVTGYGTDPIGEAEISAWELRKGIRVFGIYVQAIIFLGTLLGLIHSPKRVWAAWNRSKGSAQLPLPSLDHYEYLLTLTLKELRELYNVPLEGIAGRRVLNDNAPPRPEGIDD